jgi:Exopolysaccharide biosynthesis protein YbjH
LAASHNVPTDNEAKMIRKTLPKRRALFALTTALAGLTASVTSAENRPTLNFYGATGIIDMPSGESQPDGMLNISTAHFGPVSRTTLSFQISPRLSASFRFLGIRKYDDVFPSQFDVYYDRSFDIRYQVLREGKYLPAVTIGLQDFAGTGVLSGEYIAATKNLTPRLKATVGLGWGRLGSYGSIGSPFGDRPRIDVGKGGKFNFGTWFKGEAAPFAGLEYQVDDRWSVKAEYSSDAYTFEDKQRRTFDRKSPFNFGVEYQAYDTLRVGAYYLYGGQLGIAAHLYMNPKQRPMGGIGGPAPYAVKPRPSIAADPDAWSPEWVSQPGIAPVLMTNINKRLEKDGVVAEAIGFTGSTVQVRMRNTRYDAEAQAIGRLARAMANTLPASVEVFEIVPVVNGIPASKVTIRRSDLERLEFAPGADAQMRDAVVISNPGPRIAGLTYDPDLYPRFTWALAPYNRIRLFDQRSPFKIDVGLRLTGRYEIRPGTILQGALTKKIAGNLDDPPPDVPTGLQPVRSDVDLYDANGDPALEQLFVAQYAYLGGDVYGRISAGYLERMFGGVSAEVLWKPVNRRWALGAEVNYVAQRDTDVGLGFKEYDYRVATGHLSGYYAFANGLHAQVDVGRYLAGDVGATLMVEREFSNGWRVGAFATKTNVSEEDFGSGSFDKGIKLEIPFAWGTGQPTRKKATAIIRPFGRDGGQRLDVDGRLYDSIRDYHALGLDEQWGRFWK